jgi:hypothetical protein
MGKNVARGFGSHSTAVDRLDRRVRKRPLPWAARQIFRIPFKGLAPASKTLNEASISQGGSQLSLRQKRQIKADQGRTENWRGAVEHKLPFDRPSRTVPCPRLTPHVNGSTARP